MAETRPSIGEQLRQVRESRNLSIEKVSQETHIRLAYIQAIEAGDLEALPSPTQARGFVRAYASYLDLDLDAVLESQQLETGSGGRVVDDELPEPFPDLPEDPDSPEKIYTEIGKTLAEQRILLGFSVEDVERQTHIRAHYLKALEAGAIDELPSPVQGRGMLSNYAAFVGLDPDPMLLRYADGLQAGLATRRPQDSRTRPRQEAAVSRSGLRRLISGDMIFGGLLIFLLAIFLIWGVGRISNLNTEGETTPTEISLGGLLVGTPTPEPVEATTTPTPETIGGVEPPPDESEATSEAEIPPPAEGAVQVYIVVHQRAWMQVLVDGQEEFSGRVLPGAAFPYAGDEYVEILTGNGLALEVNYNQENLGRLGFFGEVVHQIFAVEGIFTPTPTNSPTPTSTPRVTPTPADVGPTG